MTAFWGQRWSLVTLPHMNNMDRGARGLDLRAGV